MRQQENREEGGSRGEGEREGRVRSEKKNDVTNTKAFEAILFVNKRHQESCDSKIIHVTPTNMTENRLFN